MTKNIRFFYYFHLWTSSRETRTIYSIHMTHFLLNTVLWCSHWKIHHYIALAALSEAQIASPLFPRGGSHRANNGKIYVLVSCTYIQYIYVCRIYEIWSEKAAPPISNRSWIHTQHILQTYYRNTTLYFLSSHTPSIVLVIPSYVLSVIFLLVFLLFSVLILLSSHVSVQ